MSRLLSLFVCVWLFGSSVARAEAWCTWNEAAFTGWARVRLPDTDLVWGQVSAERVSLTGALQPTATGPALRASLSQGGLNVRGDLPASDGLLFRSGVRLPLGSVGLIAEGAQVRPVAMPQPGFIAVLPGEFVLDQVKVKGAPFALLTCQQLLLSGRFNELDESAALLASLGVTEQTERAWLSTGRVKIRPMPGFPAGVIVKRRDSPLSVAVLERQGSQVKIAYDHYDGVVWTGWVRARDLATAEYTDSLGGILGSVGGTGPETVRACAEAQPLRVRVKGQIAEVGTVGPGVEFVVERSGADGAEVQFRSSFLYPEDGVALLLPEAASACPSREVPAQSVGDLFKESSP